MRCKQCLQFNAIMLHVLLPRTRHRTSGLERNPAWGIVENKRLAERCIIVALYFGSEGVYEPAGWILRYEV